MNALKKIAIVCLAALPMSFAAFTAKAGDIVDTAASADQFSTLVAAVKAAGLVDTLKGDGPFTVFAPTNEAFAVLTYHVIPGKVMSSDIAGKTAEVATVQGSALSIDATSGVMVDNAMVTTPDIITSNGVIHVIDKVVLPN